MFKFIVKDFQAIKEARVTVNGVTLLLGESNNGKSSCLRGLQAAFTNRFKNGQVRYHQDHASIGAKFDDKVILFHRSALGGSPIIEFNGQKYSKLGRTLPKEVSEFLNLGFYDMSGESYSCNFHSQFQKPLLLEYSQQRVMELLSASTDLDELKLAKDINLVERQKNKGAIQVVDSLIEETKSKCKRLESSVKVLESIIHTMQIPHSEMVELEDKLEILESAIFLHQELKQVRLRLSNLSEITFKLMNLITTQSQLDYYNELYSTYLEWSQSVKNISVIMKIIALCKEFIASKVDSLTESIYLCKSLTESKSKFGSLESIVLLLKSIVSNLTTKSDLQLRLSMINEASTVASNLSESNKRINEYKKIVEQHMCPICGNKIEL